MWQRLQVLPLGALGIRAKECSQGREKIEHRLRRREFTVAYLPHSSVPYLSGDRSGFVSLLRLGGELAGEESTHILGGVAKTTGVVDPGRENL